MQLDRGVGCETSNQYQLTRISSTGKEKERKKDLLIRRRGAYCEIRLNSLIRDIVKSYLKNIDLLFALSSDRIGSSALVEDS